MRRKTLGLPPSASLLAIFLAVTTEDTAQDGGVSPNLEPLLEEVGLTKVSHSLRMAYCRMSSAEANLL